MKPHRPIRQPWNKREQKRIPRVRTRPKLGTEEFLEHGFMDPRSHIVTRTGQIVLRGVDKTNLRHDVYRRAGGRCEIASEGKRCNRFASWDGIGHGELVHIIAIGRGGSDSLTNCEWGCPECHRKRDHPGPQWSALVRGRAREAGENSAQPQSGLDGNV